MYKNVTFFETLFLLSEKSMFMSKYKCYALCLALNMKSL